MIPQSGGLVRHTTSGSDGLYRLDGLPDGTYRVDFDLRGFELVRRNHVRVSRDTEANIDAALGRARDLRMRHHRAAKPMGAAAWSGRSTKSAIRFRMRALLSLVVQVMSTDSEGRFLNPRSGERDMVAHGNRHWLPSVTQQVSGE